MHFAILQSEFKEMSCGGVMALNYLHGYLKKVLPKTQEGSEGIEGTMKKYETTMGVKFKMYKLFILVPLSMHCPPKIQSATIEPAKVSLFSYFNTYKYIFCVYFTAS